MLFDDDQDLFAPRCGVALRRAGLRVIAFPIPGHHEYGSCEERLLEAGAAVATASLTPRLSPDKNDRSLVDS